MNTGLKNMKKFKRLYANGCSLTFGMEVGYRGLRRTADLLTPEENAYREANNWAGVLARKLQIPEVINVGKSGRSNNTIFRSMVSDLPIVDSDTLVVVGWTSLSRLDFWNNTDFTINLIPESRVRYDEKTQRLYDCLVNDGFYNRALEAENLNCYAHSVSAMIKTRGGTLVMFPAIDNDLSIDDPSCMTDCFYDDCLEKNFPIGDYWHPDAEGHAYWADKIISHLCK